MIEITIDEKRYVTNFNACLNTSHLLGSMQIEDPDNMEHFQNEFIFYKYVDDGLIFDEDAKTKHGSETKKEDIRRQRETECFSMVDRSKFWYDSLSAKQLEELKAWYEAWLDAPETSVIPEPLPWLEA